MSKSRASASKDEYSVDRLQHAVHALVDEGRRLRVENAALRDALDSRDKQVKDLDERLQDSNQRRNEARERLDGLVGRVDAMANQTAGAER